MTTDEPVIGGDGLRRREERDERNTMGGAYLVVAIAVVVTAWIDDSIDARLALILVTALTIGYMIGTGLSLRRYS